MADETLVTELLAEIAVLHAEATRHDSPAWEANERMNAKIGIMYDVVQAIAKLPVSEDGRINTLTLSKAIREAQQALVEVLPG